MGHSRALECSVKPVLETKPRPSDQLVPGSTAGAGVYPSPRTSLFPAGVTALILGGILLLGLGLRLYCLDCHGFWGDELNSLDGAAAGIPAIFESRFGWISNQTPLHYLILWLTTLPIDPTTSAALVRMPSALVGALTPLVVYGLGRELFGRVQGLLAALMLALSAVHLNHSQELRLYSMLVFLSCVSVYSLLMARRTGRARWWLAFAAATIANLANAYVADTLFMPAFAPYLAWVLWQLWTQRRANPRQFRYAFIAMLAVSLGYAAMLLQMLGASRTPPNLAAFSPAAVLPSIVELLTWFTRFGLDPQVERPLQIVLLLLALLGLGFAGWGMDDGRRTTDDGSKTSAHLKPDVRRPSSVVHRQPQASVFLCSLFLFIPAVLLLIFGSTTVVFQRYALFAMPLYFLLISNGCLALPFIVSYILRKRSNTQYAAYVPVALVLVCFAAGAYNYFSPEAHLPLSYRPDFRGAAHYLSQRASAQDTIIFIDDPGLGYTISNYYWKGRPPAPAYDARDPRLFAREIRGDIYWVVSSEDLGVLPRISAPTQGWAGVERLERVLVLREAGPVASMLDSMDRIVSKLEAIEPGAQPIITLRGCVYQARGDARAAANTYKRAGTYFPVGDDYLRTGKGFDALGDETKAWREAFISKFWQPDKPAVHKWLAQKLMDAGYRTESGIESRITQALP
jgi:hypothetical protein